MRISYPDGGHETCLEIEEESFWFAHRNRAILAMVQRFPAGAGPIFDVGAGNGYVAAALERAGYDVVAIEPSRSGAANAAARVAKVVCGSLPSEEFRFASAGAIGLFDVIEHVEDDEAFLRALAPYLTSGGRLYITVPAYQWLWSSEDAIAGHYRRYTQRTLRETLRRAGFVVEFQSYIFWCLPLAILLFRKWRRGNSLARTRRQHRIAGAEELFSFELSRIARGASIPFGGSCVAVATPGVASRS